MISPHSVTMVSLLGESFQTENGIFLPQYPRIEYYLESMKGLVPSKSDYFLCSYPKSGTHWLNEILHMLVSGTTEYTTDPISNLESGSYQDSQTDQFRILHSHLPYDMLPELIKTQKIIYIMRNPLDQIVSLYHHHQGLKWSPCKTFYQFFCDIMENPDKVEYGSWYRNAYRWWLHHRRNSNILFLFYEDLVQDLTPEIEKISTFCKLNRSQAFLQLVSKKTSFLHMKRNKPVGEWFNQWHKSSFSIYRQGESGNWQNFFTPSMLHRFQSFSETETGMKSSLLPYPIFTDALPQYTLNYPCCMNNSSREKEARPDDKDLSPTNHISVAN